MINNKIYILCLTHLNLYFNKNFKLSILFHYIQMSNILKAFSLILLKLFIFCLIIAIFYIIILAK